MRLMSFQHGDSIRIGALDQNHVIDLNRAFRHSLMPKHPHRAGEIANCFLPGDMVDFLESGDDGMDAARRALDFVEQRRQSDGDDFLRSKGIMRPLAQIRRLPTVPRPRKIFCIGKNYADHAAELGGEIPKSPEIFIRFAETLIAAGAPILKPLETDMWDYEAELAVIIGRAGRRIPRGEALQYIAGYSCFNDVSARDFQKRITQWTAGKNFQGSGPFGPHLVTADEVGDPQALDVSLVLNGETMQQASTGSMIYTVEFLIAHLSEFIALSPGDVIMTGTPGGVGVARTPQRFLKDGDVVRVVIDRVGELENPVVAEKI